MTIHMSEILNIFYRLYVCAKLFFFIRNCSFLPKTCWKESYCYRLIQITTTHPGHHIRMCRFNSSMNIMWKRWNTKEGFHYYQGVCSSPSFLISQAFSELSRVFFFPLALLLISDPAIKSKLWFIPSFSAPHTLYCQTLSSPHAKT